MSNRQEVKKTVTFEKSLAINEEVYREAIWI